MVRRLGQACSLARWLSRSLWLRAKWLAELVSQRAAGRSRKAMYPLGAEISTHGPRAAAVFSASGRVMPAGAARHSDVVLADSEDRVGSQGQAKVVALSSAPAQLSVPAFDPVVVNPIGWKPEDAKVVAAADVTAETDPVIRAGALAAATATGAVIRIVGDPDLEPRLGDELFALMSGAGRIDVDDSHSREALSIDMRRAALRGHSLRARARQVLAAAGLEAPLPRVSVLLATNRPERLDAAVASVAAQTYPNLELVLAPHGSCFAADAIERAVETAGCRVQVTPVDGGDPLGAVLNAAAAASTGALLAKMDDDDYYSREHLWDLVLAHEYSEAEMVVKAAEYVYLAGQERTLRLLGRRGERFLGFPSVDGGTMLIARHHLDQAGGWRRIPRHVDTGLAQDVKWVGGRIYRTHGRGYLRVRHGDNHTWDIDESNFTSRAIDGREGLDLAFAGIV